MAHEDYEDGLGVGCVCAEKMESDYVNPRRREQELRNAASRRRRWLARKWKTSQSGNPYLKTDGFHIVVYPLSDSSWGGKITNLATGEAVTNRRCYADADKAKLGAFDGMIFLMGGTRPQGEETMAGEDEYRSFEELRRKERENVDYSVTARPAAGSKVAIAAPHGGRIEFLTAELADSIAENEHNFYAFQGLKKVGNRALHITSHRFDEPRALKLIASSEKVITVHGLAGDALALQVGGRDAALRSRVHGAVSAAGFDSKVVTEGDYGGMEPQNICNRGSTGAGVQLEIHAGLRWKLKDDADAYNKFVAAVRSAL